MTHIWRTGCSTWAAPGLWPAAALANSFYFSGGTLQYSAANQIDYLNRIHTYNGAAFRIDTNGQGVTFATGLNGNSLIKLGAGTPTFTVGNYFANGATFAGGVLNLGDAGALGRAGTLSFTGGTLQYSAVNQSDYSARFSAEASQVYSIDTNGQNVTFTSAPPSPTGSLVKLGTGTLTLSAASVVQGNTTVSGARSSSTTRAVPPPGTVANTVEVQSGGTLDPGAVALAPGRLTLGSGLTLNSGATFAVQLGGLTAGTQHDQVRLGGVLTLAGNLSVTESNGFSPAVGQTFVIIDDTGSNPTNGAFANTTAGSLYTDFFGNTFLINYFANADGGSVPNDVTLTVTSVVPEPSTVLGGGLVLVLGLVGCYRRYLARGR